MPLLSIDRLSKTYANGFVALDEVSLDVERGEILALLGPNGAGKTTLIGVVCGIVNPSSGSVRVDGHDVVRDYRRTRSMIGLVPQELTTESFETVWSTVSFSRGLFGRAPDPAHIERVLRELSLWDKKDNRIRELSGGMKRRVLIAKALSHEPDVLFLDEPSAGVDVELRKDMWDVVRALRAAGTTIILTTHYIEEAEEMADRVAVINHGRILLVEEKSALMHRLGRKQLVVDLAEPLAALPPALAAQDLRLAGEGRQLVYEYAPRADANAVPALLEALRAAGVTIRDLSTEQSSLEDIFVTLVAQTEAGERTR